MSISLNEVNSRISFAYNSGRGLPWHGLGQPVNGLMTSQECLEKANLNFDVETSKVFDDKGRVVPNTRCIRRTDNGIIFTTDGRLVTPAYKVYNNAEAFNFMDSIVEGSKAIYETAGCLHQGQVVFITASMESFDIAKEEIKPFLFAALYHDGTGSIKIGETDIRVVCENTLRQALSSSNCISIVHKGKMSEKIEKAMNKLGILTENVAATHELYRTFATKMIGDKNFCVFVNKLFLSSEEFERYRANNASNKNIEVSSRKLNMISDVVDYYFSHPTQKSIIGTVWGAYNAITGYFQNVKSYSDPEHKFNNLIGDGEKRIPEAFKLLTNYVK